MAIQMISTGESPEEAEARRRLATARRIKILAALSIAVIGARMLISDPKRKAPIDYTKTRNIKIVPGMLDTMPAATRANLDPQLVAKMVIADEMARRGEFGKPQDATPQVAGTYRAADAPGEKDIEAEAYKEQIFAYARQRKIETQRRRRDEEPRDISKSTLVQFASGGYVLAESATRSRAATSIRVHKSLHADLPNTWVASIRTGASDWKEPVPAGQVRLKPARGITVILHRDTARRVTVDKTTFNEI